MQHQSNSQPKALTHVYVRDSQKGFIRACWSSGEELYCGMCMRGTVAAEVGNTCPICSSTVERILEVTSGGSPKFSPRHREYSIRVGEAKRTERVLDFGHSRQSGT